MATMSGYSLTVETDQLVVARMVGQMQLHLVQHCWGLYTRMFNGSCTKKKQMEWTSIWMEWDAYFKDPHQLHE